MNHVPISKMEKCEVQARQVTQLIDCKSACNMTLCCSGWFLPMPLSPQCFWRLLVTIFISVPLLGLGGWGFCGSSAGKESTCNAGDPCLIPGSGRPPGEGTGYPLQYSWASLVAQLVKNLPAGDLGSIPGLGRPPGEGNSYPLQYSGLDYTVHGVCKESDTTEQLSLPLLGRCFY